MNDDGYEYKIADDNPLEVQVKDPYKGMGPHPQFRHYMTCESQEQAWRVLNLLQYAKGEEAVRE